MLNLARDDVREYIFGFLDKLATDYHIRYFKWDMNRTFAEPGWPEVAPEGQKELWVRYVRNLYDILARLRAKHPDLEIESCSGGGGRVDLGILRYVDEFWTSDNTEPFDRLQIQEGFSEAYAAKLMSAWVTDVPNQNGRTTSLTYRFLVAMQGALGIGANLNKWSDEDSRVASRLIALDKRIRDTVQYGNLHRLLSPRTSDTTTNEYVGANGKQAVLFAFRHSQQYKTPPPVLYLQGLDSRALYHVSPIDGKLPWGARTLSGAFLMQNGLQLALNGDFDSTVIVLERVNP